MKLQRPSFGIKDRDSGYVHVPELIEDAFLEFDKTGNEFAFEQWWVSVKEPALLELAQTKFLDEEIVEFIITTDFMFDAYNMYECYFLDKMFKIEHDGIKYVVRCFGWMGERKVNTLRFPVQALQTLVYKEI